MSSLKTPDARGTERRSAPPPSAKSGPFGVLMVDDQPANLLALEATLEAPDLELVRAGSGDEALRLALGRDFALILLDVQMPGLDGFETATLLKQRPALRATPIIFLSAEPPAPEELERARKVGATDFLVKPLDTETLRAKVKAALAPRARPSVRPAPNAASPDSGVQTRPPSEREGATPAGGRGRGAGPLERPALPSPPRSPGAARLRQALEAAGLGALRYDPAAREFACDARCKALFGLPAEAEATYELWLDRLAADDRARLEGALRGAPGAPHDGALDVELRALGPGGGRVAAKGLVLFEGGRAQRVLGVVLELAPNEGRAERCSSMLDLGLAIARHLAEL
ncbi:MAG TPA: response regulator [Polyangiaceae bacterium]|nr:response regulator [Polyangiaceae bacterium]